MLGGSVRTGMVQSPWMLGDGVRQRWRAGSARGGGRGLLRGRDDGAFLRGSAAGAVAMMPAASLRAARSARTLARRASGFTPLVTASAASIWSRRAGRPARRPARPRPPRRGSASGDIAAAAVCGGATAAGGAGSGGVLAAGAAGGCAWSSGAVVIMWALSSGGGCAARCGGESAEGGDGIGHLVGETGEDRRLAAEHGRFGAQRAAGCRGVARDRRRRFRRRAGADPPARPAIRARTASGRG